MSAPTASSQSSVRPFVLSKQQIDALPFENFGGDRKKATGGWRNIFSSPQSPTDGLTLGIATFPPRSAEEESFEALHRHAQAEFYYILSGHAVVKIEGVDHEVTNGHALFIPGDAEHGFWNTSSEEELVFLWGFGIDGFGEVVYRFSHE
ncbi:hypothetical protein N8T08_004812 [Aspergillus melleus]|uniref:Uncharacterized protein n=1 Tax=Aspergillus melleus TaxID=138277 RepID=A0ACC3B3M9_9EURO|nr:hypothetical protein N8T08_004812 [Aspergillus melleus]